MIGLGLGLSLGNPLFGSRGPAAPPAYAHNSVTFHQDKIVRNTANVLTGFGNTTGMMLATKINIPSLPATGVQWCLFCVGGTGNATAARQYLLIDEFGNLQFTFRDGTNVDPVLIGQTGDRPIAASTDLSIHVSVDATASAVVTDLTQVGNGVTVDFVPVGMTFSAGDRSVAVAVGSVVQTWGVDYTQIASNTIRFTVAPVLLVELAFHKTDTNNRVKVWVNGVKRPLYVPLDTATDTTFTISGNGARFSFGQQHNSAATPTYNATTLLGYDGAGDLSVLVDYIIFDDAANGDPATTSTNGTDIDLVAFEGVALVYLGGEQVAADWNAGTNLGTGGAMTMVGTVA